MLNLGQLLNHYVRMLALRVLFWLAIGAAVAFLLTEVTGCALLTDFGSYRFTPPGTTSSDGGAAFSDTGPRSSSPDASQTDGASVGLLNFSDAATDARSPSFDSGTVATTDGSVVVDDASTRDAGAGVDAAATPDASSSPDAGVVHLCTFPYRWCAQLGKCWTC